MVKKEEYKFEYPILAVAVRTNCDLTYQPYTYCLRLMIQFKGFKFDLKGRHGVCLSGPGW